MAAIDRDVVEAFAVVSTDSIGALVKVWAGDDFLPVHQRPLNEAIDRFKSDLDGLMGAIQANRDGA